MTKYAENTRVSSEQSRNEIERLVMKYGAGQFVYGTQEERAVIGFTMVNRQVKFFLPLPRRSEFSTYKRGYTTYDRSPSATADKYEQAVRQRWRALALVIKAKLEAVESGITEFESEFLAHIVMPNGQTVGEALKPQIESAYQSGKMPPLLGYDGAADGR